jgi:hypothetical protein
VADPVLVQNAADAEQVERGARLQARRRAQARADLRAVLATAEGRRVLWRLLEHCGVFESIWHPSAEIHYRAGRQDVGHWLMAEISEADDEALMRMFQEARARARQEAQEAAAGRVRRGQDDA